MKSRRDLFIGTLVVIALNQVSHAATTCLTGGANNSRGTNTTANAPSGRIFARLDARNPDSMLNPVGYHPKG